jgi:hypothetical protein
MTEYRMTMLTNAKPGRDAEFKNWYEGHLDDMLRLPGVVAAQCFDFDTELSVEPVSEYRYLAIYEFDTDNLGETLGALQAAVGTAAMPMSDAMAPKTHAVVFRARGERRMKR